MMKFLAAILLTAPLFAAAQTTTLEPDPKVTVTSQGHDVRMILTNIFAQAKKSVVLQPSIQYNLYLTLQNTDFTKALDVICSQGGLVYEIRDGIYHVHKRKPVAPKTAPVITPTSLAPVVPQFASGQLSTSVLKHRLTTRLKKTNIRTVLEEFGKQTQVKIEISPDVPSYQLDAYLTKTSLKYALDQVTKAAKLQYSLTDHETILVTTRDALMGSIPTSKLP